MPIVGMYTHTHWGYNQPYCVRTWTLEHWRGYLAALKRLGYNLIQMWPMLDTIPVPPTPSDAAYLERLRQVIDLIHEMGMDVYLGICANTAASEKAASFTFENRRYFEAQKLVNPADKAEMDAEMERRRVLLEPLSEADGLWIIDSDPGGYAGSPVSEFVEILARHRELLDRIGSNIKLVYWMWAGWLESHSFEPDWVNKPQQMWIEALEGLMRLDPEPWWVQACFMGHFRSILQVGLPDERVSFYPYGLVEQEPSYPFTNWMPQRIADHFATFSDCPHPLGVVGNCQTHCVQLPHTYVFSHFAHGGSMENLDPVGFAERLIPGAGEKLTEAWKALAVENDSADSCRRAADAITDLLQSRDIRLGGLGGLFFEDVRRYLEDLLLQIDLWANVIELRHSEKTIETVKPLLRSTLDSFHAWTDRHGFVDHYHDRYFYATVRPVLEQALRSLGTSEADHAAELTDMRTNPHHGQLQELLDAMDLVVGPSAVPPSRPSIPGP